MELVEHPAPNWEITGSNPVERVTTNTMSETTYTAQKREKNDSVHIYTDDTEAKQNPVTGEVTQVNSAVCTGPPLHQPTMNDSEPTFEITVAEINNNDYLERDGEIIGKICGNCKRCI